MSITTEIKKFVYSCDMDLVGIASAETLNKSEPEGHRPEDILPGAKSVIVYGKRIADGVTQTIFRGFEDGRKNVGAIFGTYGYELAPNFILLFNTFKITQYIERTFGKTTVPLPNGPLQNAIPVRNDLPYFTGPVNAGLPFNIENAAVACGLGEFGWSNRLLTPEYGPRVKFGAVITTLELDPDAPYSGPKLCNPEECKICADVCPTHAIPEYSKENTKEYEVGGVSCRMSKINANRCAVAACALRKEFNGDKDYIESLDPSDEELAAAFEKRFHGKSSGLDRIQKWRCEKCLAYCPVGDWDKRFRSNSLTKN